MEVEKEVRFLVDDKAWDNALKVSDKYKEKVKMLDITMGAYGRESLAKTGRIFRVRQKPNKVTLEVKQRTTEGWLEESVKLESVNQGVNFLTLAGLKPYLYISRFREVRKYKGLKIFFDDVELLGKFIEVEYQDSVDAEKELQEFINICKIKNNPQPLYGDIINERYNKDEVFKQKFDEVLDNLIN